MLPPVLASANQVTTATEARQRPDQIAITRPATVSPVVTSGRIDQSSAIAGQLNIMLLSGPERMSQNLAALADVLGAALKIERRPEESLNDYMGRLIAGIAALPPGDRAKLQKLLSQAFAGLQLRTLLEAMASPSGPERATLALYLELYRQKDQDGATRSVISSYRELAGEGRSNALNAGRTTAANDRLRPAAVPEPSPAKAVSLPPLSPSTPSPNGQKPGEDHPSSPASIQDPRASSTPLPSQARGATPPGSQSQADARAVDAMALKSVSVPAAESGPSQTEAASKAGRSLPPSAVPLVDRMEQPQVSDIFAPSANRTAVSRGEQGADTTDTSAKAQTASPMPLPTAELGAKPALPQAGGWLAELLEMDFVKTLLALKTLSMDEPTAAPQGALDRPIPADPQPPTAATDPKFDTEETELASPIPEAAQASDTADNESQPVPFLLAEQAATRPILAREWGVPLPFVSYLIEDEVQWEEEVREEDEREAEDEGHPEEEADREGEEPSGDVLPSAETDDQPADHGTTPALPHGDATRTRALPAPSDTGVPLPPEPAHELYLRMAGLN